MHSLSDQDLARLHAKFVVPIVVDQMLRETEPLDDVAEHAMNEILFELCPDTALLCIAMCVHHIARETAGLPISKALSMQAEQIIDEYGALWLAHEQNPDALDDAQVYSLLAHIPEDFEALRDLLDATLAALDEDHSIAAILCDILSMQADHHGAAAEAELLALSIRPQKQTDMNDQKKESMPLPGANVIPFPGGKKAKRAIVS